ncbi:Eight transmembrane protein EpsH [Verrucomicrobia bacterium]|nr:Eight transmembrane protein EpsH [Verrucomicrobiota bacterium]
MDTQSNNGILEEFRLEFLECWQRLPNKGFFLFLLAAWLGLFQFLGNSTLGYVHSSSLLRWMHDVYQPNSNPGGFDDAHARFIPLVVLVLFWWKRKELMALPLKAWSPGLMLVGLGLALHILGFAVQQPRLSIIALFTGIYGLMGLAWGPAWLKASFFPFFLFAFCVPLGTLALSITFPLRLLVCQLVELICNTFLAIDVTREGTALIDPSGHYRYEVAAACSGMRSLIATVAMGLIYGMLSFRTWWRRALIIASAFPLAVLGNVIRMLTIVIAAELGGQEWGNWVHEGGPGGILSLLPYVPAFGGMLLLGHWLREKPRAPAPHWEAAGPPTGTK